MNELRTLSIALTAPVACLALALALATATSATSAQSSANHRLVKACGTVDLLGSTLAVDIAEGRLPTTCREARRIIRVYVSGINGGTDDPSGCCFMKIRRGSKVWGCYKSRQDGVGWDYHCNRAKKRTKGLPIAKTFVDVGAGRRF